MDVESTSHLIERARAGDQEALDRLLARHVTPLRRWARGRLPKWARDVADTDDLVQDTLLQTFRRLGRLRGSRAWRAAGVPAPGHSQSRPRRAAQEGPPAARQPISTGSKSTAGVSPLEEAIGHEAIERYEHALAALRPDEREAIIGRVEMGYSYEELAEVLGKPSPDAARKAAQRALVRLIRQMEPPGHVSQAG